MTLDRMLILARMRSVGRSRMMMIMLFVIVMMGVRMRWIPRLSRGVASVTPGRFSVNVFSAHGVHP